MLPPKRPGLPPTRSPKSPSPKAVVGREIWEDLKSSKKPKQVFERTKDGGYVQAKPDLEFEPIPEEAPPGTIIPEPRKDYEYIEETLGYTFKDRILLERALTHRSALRGEDRVDYERLEFLGDAVLGLTMAHALSDKHLDAKEGALSKMRAALVNTKALADIAKKLGLGAFVKLGWSEMITGGADRPSILADVVEAIIGAIYSDSNYEVVRVVVERLYGDEVVTVSPSDPKTELQVRLHIEDSDAPSYQIEIVEGAVHAPTFVAVVIVDGVVAGRGRGNTKKAAHQEAASEALRRLEQTADTLDSVPKQNFFFL